MVVGLAGFGAKDVTNNNPSVVPALRSVSAAATMRVDRSGWMAA
jgi:hypothetical protein